jgi:hypothetical protein
MFTQNFPAHQKNKHDGEALTGGAGIPTGRRSANSKGAAGKLPVGAERNFQTNMAREGRQGYAWLIIYNNKTIKKLKNPFMSTLITARDLAKEAPASPRQRLAGFVIARRAVDKCRASLAGTAGEYHFDCPLDKVLFNFKGITGEQFKTAVQAAKHYEDVGAWLLVNGTAKTPAEIKAWSDEVEASSLMKNPEKRGYFIESCHKIGLNPEMNSTFDWLEADDRSSFFRRAV